MYRGLVKLYKQPITPYNQCDADTMKRYLCLQCTNYQQEELEGYYANITPHRVKYYPPETRYSCKATGSVIIVLRTHCKQYISITQTKLKVGDKGMVKIEDIPSEGARVELADLPKEVELIALSEKMAGQSEGKVGGLVIEYKLRDDRTFSQKYTKVSGVVLGIALKKLKIKDTVELQSDWYTYSLTAMRIGFPRMIPIKKAQTQ